jgi:PIN like domain
VGSLTFYFDRNFGRRFPEALHQASPPFAVEYHHSPRSRFAHNATDDKWLDVVGQHGWIVFSHDQKFHQILPEVSAIKQHGIGCFYLWGAEARTWDKLCFFIAAVEKIMWLAEDTKRPFVYRVTKTRRFEAVPLT